MSLAKKSSKKDSSSNGNVKPSKTNKSQTIFKKPLLARNKSLEGTEPSKFAPKMRISPQQLRRNLKSPPPEQESENSNNSNIRPIVALKPKSIVRETVKSGNKLPMTMNDTLNVPKPVAKNNKKNLFEVCLIVHLVSKIFRLIIRAFYYQPHISEVYRFFYRVFVLSLRLAVLPQP